MRPKNRTTTRFRQDTNHRVRLPYLPNCPYLSQFVNLHHGVRFHSSLLTTARQRQACYNCNMAIEHHPPQEAALQLLENVMTADEFEAFALLPENSDRLFEFIGGRVVEGVSDNLASEMGGSLLAEIRMFSKQNKLGRVTGADGGYVVAGEKYIPDVGFMSKARQPVRVRAAYNPVPPDLVVEVLSPNNHPDDMRIKVANYLSVGTVVWLVNPDLQRVEVYVPHQPVKILGINDTLDGGTVLPGFQLALRDLFDE